MMEDKKSILVVDDELDFLAVIRRILKVKGYEVTTASSAGDAIACAQEHFYSVAILDISLPDMAGTELLSILLKIHPDTVAVMLTGHSSVQNAVTSLNRGAFAYLEKPMDPEHLLSVLEQGLDKQRLARENQKLLAELEERNRITSILLEVSQSAAKSLDLRQIIEASLAKVAGSIAVESAFLLLFEERLALKGQHGLAAPAAAKMAEAVPAIFSKVYQEGEPVLVDDIADEPDLAFLDREGYRSAACVPLMILGESIGVLGVAGSSLRHFSTGDIGLLTAIGREIAIAVQNSRLYEQASSARALRELDSMRTEFLANISHELRTPLAVIKGSASSLLQPDVEFDEMTRREFLQSIDKDADRLSRLVNDLLMMSRLEAGTLTVVKKPHRLADIISGVKDRLDSIALRHHLRVDIPEELPPVVADDGRIGEVLTNLVENATKHAETGTVITISACVNEGRKIEISVSDEGIGIPEELQQKIFQRFYQVENSKRGNRKGTGLGLAICRGIIEAHGGRIWVASASGKGAKFSFTLPVSEAADKDKPDLAQANTM
ncbi:MAG: ATP-binding protein [Dehalococcoidales bacterium]|nr:ATP-binding protein [Dehalococcoidales bacterium]